eukprot:scaffold656_cov271-Chaetoceros_neogracile.AAC.74
MLRHWSSIINQQNLDTIVHTMLLVLVIEKGVSEKKIQEKKQIMNNLLLWLGMYMQANGGCDLSVKEVQEGYKRGFVTKDDHAKTARAYGNSIDEMRSDDRDRAAAFRT